MFEYILFDLDGTLTDPKEGICKSVQYALKKANIDEPDIDKLTPFIGPPLIDSFKDFYGMDEETAKQAVSDYRERFSVTGLYENEMYKGVDDMLCALKDKGIKLAVASSKPTVFVKKILKHFKIQRYFDVVVGSELDGTRSEKSEVVLEALRQLYNLENASEVSDFLKENKAVIKKTAMVGDRKFDINGAKSFGIAAVGVKFGYAPKGELEKAGADYIAPNVKDLEEYLLGLKNVKKKNGNLAEKSSFFKSINVILPLVWYYFLMMIVVFLGLLVTNGINGSGDTEKILWLSENSTLVSGWIQIVATIFAVIGLWLLFRKTDELKLEYRQIFPVFAITGALLAVSLNVLLTAIALKINTPLLKYEESQMLKTLPAGLGVIIYVILSPLAEEIVFRWLMYGRMKKMLNVRVAIFISAVFFGFYHQNMLQGIYAFIMGIIITMIYEKAGTIVAPFIFHAGANACIYALKYASPEIQNVVTKIPVAVVMLIAGSAITAFVYRLIGKE